MFVFANYALRDRQWLHLLSLGGLGVLAAIIFGSVVLQRNAHAQADRVQAAQSLNVPKLEAAKALAKAEEALTKAAASAECAELRALACVQGARVSGEGSSATGDRRPRRGHPAENPTTAVLGSLAGTFQQAMAVAPAIWLELAAPAVLAFGFAPWPRKEPAPRRKVRRRGRRAPKPAPRSARARR